MVSSIKLNKKTATIKRKGKITLRATVGPATANNKAVTWVSSNKKIQKIQYIQLPNLLYYISS